MAGSGLDKRTGGLAVNEIGTDPDVFERFYREHIEAVKRFVARRVDDPYLVADLTADVFVAAIDSAASYDGRRGAPGAWLCGIARHVVASELRRRTSRQRLSAKSVVGRELVHSEDLPALHERIDAESSGRAIYREMDRLSDADRAVLELVALDGLEVREAAAVLGITAAAARVRLYRARRLLQSKLEHLRLDDDPKEVLQ
jgi:RNA polymerase sigma-70 factor (ECF subfamily)